MANTVIQLKKSIVPGNVPSSLENGEIAINTADGILFYKDPSNVIRTIRTDTTTNAYSVLNVNSSLLIATSNSDILSIDSTGAITLTPDSVNDKFTIGVKSGTVFEEGVVQLYDGVDSNSIVLVATANAVFNAYVHANAAFTFANTISAGSIDSYARDKANSAYNEANSKIDLLTQADFISEEKSVPTSSANQVLDLFSTETYRTVKYLIQIENGLNYQSSELLLIQDGNNSFITEYAVIATNGSLAIFDSNINSGNVQLLITPFQDSNNVRFVKTAITS